MTAPTVKAELAFGAAPFADPATWTWTDVSAYVAGSIVITRGRPTELDDFSPGTCRLPLANESRRFDPEHAAGPYFGQLIENVPLRITVTGTGGARVRFLGFVDGWPQRYAPPASATCDVTATDAMKLLNRVTLPESVYAYEVAKDAPKVWLRLGETTGEIAADSSGHVYDGRWNRADDQHSSVALVDGSSDGAAAFDGRIEGDYVAISNSAALIAAAPFAVEMWVKADQSISVPAASVVYLMRQDGPTSGAHIDWLVTTSSGPGAAVIAAGFAASGTGTNYADATGHDPTDGARHHLVFYNPGTLQIILDGVRVDDSTSSQIDWVGLPANIYAGGIPVSYGFLRSFPGSFDEFAIYSTDITLARIQAHYAAGIQP